MYDEDNELTPLARRTKVKSVPMFSLHKGGGALVESFATRDKARARVCARGVGGARACGQVRSGGIAPPLNLPARHARPQERLIAAVSKHAPVTVEKWDDEP